MINLIHGDCVEVMKDFSNDSIDLIVTSPPYNIGNMKSNNTSHGTYQNNNMKEKDYQNWQLHFLNECFRVLKKDGSSEK